MPDRRLTFRLAAAFVLACLAASVAQAQFLGPRFSLEELGQMVADSTVVVRAKATAEPIPEGGSASGLAWRVPCDVVEVLRGELKGAKLELHIRSPLESLGMSKKDISGATFVLPLQLYADGGEGHFRLVNGAGFKDDSPEGRKLAEIAKNGEATGTVSPLRVRVEAVRPPYEAGQAAPVRVIIENTSAEPIIYRQPPLVLVDGQLYIPGSGQLSVTDSRGNTVSPTDLLHEGTKPAGETTAMMINPRRPIEREIDLARFFDLSKPDNYLVSLVLDSPDGKEQLRSNSMALQIIPELVVGVEPVRPTPAGPDAVRIPSPEAYAPGEAVNGLAMLLKPTKVEYQLGDRMYVELRLINVGDQPISVDTRLERTLLVSVEPQAGSPDVKQMAQRFQWSDDEKAGKVSPFAYLRPLAFWGKLVNVNSLYGRDVANMLTTQPSTDMAAEIDYERFGMILYAFDKPGVYKIQATYVAKPLGGEGPRVWASKLTSNPAYVRVVDRQGAAVPEAPVMPLAPEGR